MEGSVDAIIDDGDFDWWDMLAFATGHGGVHKERRIVSEALDPRVGP